MEKNNFKETMINQLNEMIGKLISLRTVESDQYNTGHWTSHHIFELSTIRNTLHNNEDICSECLGEGGIYPAYAESVYDGEPCAHCHGYGFTSRSKVIESLKELRIDSQSKFKKISEEIDVLFNLPLYKE